MLVWDDHTKLSFPSCHCTSLKGAPLSQCGAKNIFIWESLAIFYDTITMSQKSLHPTTGILKMCRFHPSTSTCMLNFSHHVSALAASGPSIIDDAGMCKVQNIV